MVPVWVIAVVGRGDGGGGWSGLDDRRGGGVGLSDEGGGMSIVVWVITESVKSV